MIKFFYNTETKKTAIEESILNILYSKWILFIFH